MKVLIYGGGAVGLGIASFLLKSKAQVDIIARENSVLALRKHGLVRTGIWGDYSAEPAAFGSYTSLSKIGTKIYDYILVCTKSFDSSVAAKDLAQYDSLFGEKTKIVLFQNGWGNAEIFQSFFDKKIIYNARVITGFSRPKNNEVTITVHADSIHVGSLFNENLECIEKLCQSIDKGGIPCEATSEIEKDLWAKMLYNCALNPLGAILDVPYGVLAEHEPSRIIMKGIVEEIFDVIKAAGHQTHWQSPKGFLEVFYRQLIPDTAKHKSSTLQDILAKKKTEIDALNGAVIKLYNIVKFIEAKNS
ncbi:MAG: ketopantoate reductase family protein [Planctomycetota bacterium]|jgi:2-dehydropantoate 2-reductase